MEAFHSTLEEALNADLLVLVHDLSAPDMADQRATVLRVLRELGAGDKPCVEAFNKIDAVDFREPIDPPGAVYISAKTGEGLDRLREEISRRVAAMRARVELTIPFDKGAALSALHAVAEVLSQEYGENGATVVCRIDAVNLARIQKMLQS